MRAISIRQPWAWAIIHAGKDIENRDWPTRVRGLVLVHASKGMTHHEYEDAMETIFTANARGTQLKVPTFEQLERGGIIGMVNVVDCVTASPSPWFFGEYGFVLRDPKPLPFRPFKGALGWFEVPDLTPA